MNWGEGAYLLSRLAFDSTHDLVDDPYDLILQGRSPLVLGRWSFLLLHASGGRRLGAWLGSIGFRLGNSGFFGSRLGLGRSVLDGKKHAGGSFFSKPFASPLASFFCLCHCWRSEWTSEGGGQSEM